MANINSVITYNANLSPAQAQIKALTAQVGALSAAFNTLDKSALSAQRSLASTFAANVGQIGGFTAQTVKANDAVTTFGKQLAANRLTMREYFREAFTGYARQNSMLRQLAAQQVRYQQSIAVPTGAGQAMLMTPQSINAASNAAQLASQRFSIFNQLVNGGATAMLNWGKNTQWAGRQLMVGFTVPLMLFTAVASKQFRDLDKELTRFQKVYGSDLGGAITESTQRMRDQVEQLAYDISRTYGIAAKDTAALAADIAATGAEGEKLMASVEQTTRLAVLGEVDRQEAMKATLSLQSAFRMNTNELAESINFLNAVENQTSATLEDLATAIPKVGPVVRSLGGDVKDLATLLVAMREGGIPAAEAANALKSGLASLINPTKQASEVAKQFGVDLVGIVEANRGQLMPTIYAMQDALNGLDSFSRSRIIEQIFGKYQFARITALFDNIGRTGSQTQSVIELASRSSAELAAVANGEIRTLTESTAVKFQRTLENLKNSIIPIGQALTETLIPIFEFIGKGVSMFTSFFQALPEPIKNFAKYGVAIAALAGPVIMLVGLFGNLIANGIKFGMMLTRLGARIAGIKTEKFELLNKDVMAAKLGVDSLTTAFTTQETAMKRLVGVLSAYEQSLRRLSVANPALFIPGAVPARGALPIKRQAGSTRPEFVPGSGRGDKIPAMLEPGEFIVNRAATEKYAPVLMQMNRGTLPGFQEGTQLSHLYTAKTQSVGSLLQLPFLDQGARAMLMLIQSIHGADFQVKTYTNAVVGLSTGLNQSMERGQASIEIFRREISDAGTAFDPLREQLRVMISETGEFSGDLNLAQQAVDSFAQQMRAQAAGFKGTTFNARQLEAMSMAALAGVSDPRQRAALMRLFETPTAFSAGKGLTASNMYMFGQASGIPMYSAGEGRSKRIYAQLGPEEYLGVRPRGERIPLGNMPTYQGAQISPLSIALPVGARTLSQPYSAPTMYTAEGQRITRSMASSMGGTQREVFMRQIEASAATFIDDLARAFVNTVARTLEAASPSRKADREMAVQGKNFGDGATQGFIRGYKSSAAGKPIIAGPVGGTGVESISNAQKIAQADQSILKMKTLQQKFTADRVRAEVELGALDARLIQIRNSETMTAQEKLRAILALNQERIALEKTHKAALENETRIQNIINGYKQKIADADAAQLRSEQTEAQAAARRAAGSIGIGPGGASGWLMGGVSPYAKDKTPDWLRSRMDQAAKDAAKGRSSGPIGSLSSARQAAGARGGGVMNAAFMASMAMSSVAMLGGASSDAAMKIGLFSTALMTATMMMQSVSAKGMFTNFLGMGSLGKGLTSRGAASIPAPFAPNLAGATAARGAGFAGAGSMGLLRAGSMFSMLGGPVGIAAGLGITGAIAGFMMYRKAADEARERAIAAFNDPVKSAEYFGTAITNVSDILEKNRLSNISEDLTAIDDALRGAVKEDYAPLIEQIKYLSAGAGAQQLSVAYSNMILSGMSAENAKAAVEAIAAEAGIAGGKAFNEAVSQGFLEEMTTSEAVQRVIGQFNPAEIKYGETDQSVLSMLQEDLAGLEARRDEIERLMSRGGRNQQLIAEYNTLGDQIDAIADRIEDLTTINPDLVGGVLDSLVMAYQQDPSAAIDGLDQFVQSLDKLSDSDREAAINKMGEYISEAYGEQWTAFGATIDESNEKIVATQMLLAGISLDKAINDANQFDAALGRALVTSKLLADSAAISARGAEESFFGMISDFAEQRRGALTTEITDLENSRDAQIKMYEDKKEAAAEAFEAEQEARQESIDGLQEEMDQRREAFEEEIDGLTKRRDAIKKSSDAFIKSLEDQRKAESFYVNQRKSAFSALQKLASGDVFGFLQERQQMSANAQENAYDETISGIEEKRDLEIEAIDDTIEKEREKQEEYEKNMQDKIDAQQKLMDEEQKAHDARMEHYDDQIAKVKRVKDTQIREKRTELSELRTMEDDYRTNATEAEDKWSKKYSELKERPYINARKQMLRWRVEEIYFRGEDSLAGALTKAMGPSASESFVPSGIRPLNTEEMLRELGFTGSPGSKWAYQPGDTGVGTDTVSSQVRDMNVDAQNVTINGDINGGNNPPTTNVGNSWTAPDGTQYRWDSTTGSYVRLAGGGKVSGPGGPKSDVIPALLSNGEYVIQASSVKKYGPDLMHSINAGKFANGGIVKAGNGTYVSADRAETQASGGVYAGGWKRKPKYFGGTPTSTTGYTKPGPAYSGGTPTYSGGYTTTNRQAEGKGKKDRNNPYTRGGYSRGYNTGRAGEGFSLIGRGISESINQRGIWGMLSDMVSSISADPRSLIPFYGLSSIDTSTQAGKDMLSATALMEILGVIPGVGVPFKAISMAGRSGVRSLLRPRTVAYAAGHTPLDANEAAAKYFPDVFRAQSPVRGLYSPSKTDPLILDESPSSPFAQASARDSYLENIFSQPKGGQGGISPGGWVIGKDGVERYVKTPQSGIPQAAYSEVLTAKLYERLGFNVPNMSLLRLGAEGRAYKLPTPIKYRSDPFADDPSMFKPGSLVISSDKLEFDPFGGSSAPEILAREQGFGTAMDQWLHFTDMHPGNFFFSQGKAYRMDFGSNPFYNPEGYPSSGKLFTNQSWIKVRKEYEGYPSISPAEISDQWRVLSNAIQNRGGLGKLIQLISSDIQEKTGIQLSNQSRVVSLLEKRLREGLRLTENPENMSITTLPPRSFSGLYADGGLVQKFAEGGLVGALKKWMKPEQFELYDNWSGFGSSTKPTGIMMHHTAGLDSLDWVARTGRVQYGSSPGPVVSSYASRAGKAYILGKGPIPGWGAGQGSVENLRENFPELAKEIEKYGHASNSLWQVEAESLGSKQDFTSSQMDAVARMTAAIREYSGWNTFRGRIINHRDWAPGRKPDTLYPVSLFERNAEKVWEEGSGEGSEPTDDGRRRKGRGKESPEVLMPTISGSGNKVIAGKALPSYVFARQLPGKGEGGGGGGGGRNPSPSNPSGKVTFRNIPDGYTVDDANRTLGYIKSGGWPTNLQRIAWTIAMRESGGRNIYDTGDYGIFQLNKPSYGDQPWWTSDRKIQYDPVYNSSMAYQNVSSRGRNFLPWAMRINKNGTYEWDWSYYNPRPSWADTTEKRTAAFWNSWVQKANGGYISGPGTPTSDSIPALLSNGEYVVKASSVRKYGKGFMDKINAGQIPSMNNIQPVSLGGGGKARLGYASGGLVGSMSPSLGTVGSIASYNSPVYNVPSNVSNSNQIMREVVNKIDQSTNQMSGPVKNSNRVKIVINGAGNKSARAIANQVARMIRSSNDRRISSRSAG